MLNWDFTGELAVGFQPVASAQGEKQTQVPAIAQPELHLHGLFRLFGVAEGGAKPADATATPRSPVGGSTFGECRNLTQLMAEFLLGGHFYFKPESRASASSFIMLTHSRSVISVLRSGTPMYERISAL